MKCKFNSKLECMDCIRKCITCSFRRNSLLTAFCEITEDDPLINERTRLYFCPFCLHRDFLLKFSQEKNKMFRCPECETDFHMDTLVYVNGLSPKDFGTWVYRYPYYEYWRKCSFEKFKDRLYSLKISNEFWEAYNK